LCIVPEDEVKSILKNIKNFLNETGLVYIGFCNPKIFQVAESNLDFRFPTGNKYEDNHDYKKVKKELEQDIKFFNIIKFNKKLEIMAVKCIEKYQLKTLDSIQLSSAVLSGADNFIVSDLKLLNASRKEKLTVINPN
jgi:hypothetical protein